MKDRVEELTLLLLQKTSWEDGELPTTVRRSWKGYPFKILDQLREADYIRGSNQSKSVTLTAEGMEKAEQLMKKYFDCNEYDE